jgi:hypothetical protein
MKPLAGRSGFSRRDLLGRLAAAGAVAAVATAVPQAGTPTGSVSQAVTVFRLRTRNSKACRACRIHHRYMVFISLARAVQNRAHPGCNCPITKQKIAKDLFSRIFLDTGAIEAGVVDLRHVGQ